MINLDPIKNFLFFLLITLTGYNGYSQVGINTVSPENSSALDVYATNKGFLPPRLTTSQRDAIANPATGLIVFCTDCDSGRGCLNINLGAPSSPNWNCVGANSASIDCSASLFVGDFYAGVAVSGTKVRYSITNNSFVAFTAIDFSAAVTLSGAGSSGISITSGQNSNVNIGSGQTVIVEYTITGTPSTGAIVATFNRLGLNCVKTTATQLQPPTINCSGIAVTTLTPAAPLANGSNYTGALSVPYTVAADGLSYVAESVTINGLTVSRAAGNYTAPSGTIAYTLSGTYTGTNLSEIFTLTFGTTVCNNVLVGTMRTCKDLATSQPSGVYTIDPDGNGGEAPFQCYCDNVNNGGGWMLVAVRQGSTSVFNESLANPLMPAASTGKLSVWSSSNSSFNFNNIRFTNDNLEHAIATFSSITTLNSLNANYPTYTSTPVAATITGSDSRLTSFYLRGQSGANIPYLDASDWAYMAFSVSSIGGLGDAWDRDNAWWILSGVDSNADPFTTTIGHGKVNIGSAGNNHWSAVNTTSQTAKTYVWLK